MKAKKPAKKEVPEVVDAHIEVITAFKGFDKNMQCRGYQFEIGKTYQHEGPVIACNSGFHSCENLLDVLNYYPLIGDDGNLNRFAIVKASGTISRHGDDLKIASASLTVEAEIKLPEIIKSAIRFFTDICTSKEPAASGNYSQLAASGKSSIAVSSATSCTASVGENGCIVLTRWVESEKRYRVSVAYEGENGIKPNVFYSLDENGEFAEVSA